jgi:hypothetical protein
MFRCNNYRAMLGDVVCAPNLELICTLTPTGNKHLHKAIDTIPHPGTGGDESDAHGFTPLY